METEKINEILELAETSDLSVTEIAKLEKISREEVLQLLIDNEYYDLKDKVSPRLKAARKVRAAAKYFIEHNGDIAYSRVADEFKITNDKLKKYLNTWYPDVSTDRKKDYDDTIFDTIDTEEKAYWLGFIYADGTISSFPLEGKPKYTFELALSINDKEHLEKFARFVKRTAPVSDKIVKRDDKEYHACRICINSKHLWETLNSYGCTPRKSLTLKWPDENIFKDKSLIIHFIRGYFDGDGSLGIYDTTQSCNGIKYEYKENKCRLGFLGTPDFLQGIVDYFIVPKNIKSKGTEKYPDKAYALDYATREAFYVGFCMYNNCNIYLERKYNKFKNEFCRLYKELYKELVDKIGEGCDANTELILKITKGFKTV